jgi:CBS-domain-containing membrane protein
MKLFQKEITLIDKNFKNNRSHYIVQCLMATTAVMLILFTIDSMFREVMIAAFGATAFLIFAMPHIRTSRVRSVLGGYIIGIILGVSLYHLSLYIYTQLAYHWIFSVMGGLAVGLSLLIMTMTNTEHPPAAGLALGLVLQGYHGASLIIIFVSVLLLLIIKYLLRHWLINLY